MGHPQHTLHGADCGSSARRYASALLILAAANSLIACGGASSDSPTGSTTSGSATLTWSAVTAPNLQGYRIYHRTAAGTYQPLGQGQPTGTTTYQVTNLSSQTTYYMVVTAYDSLGNESAYSNEVSKTIP